MNWPFFKKSIVILLSLMVLLMLILNAYYVWNWGDDYLIKYFYKERSPIKYLWDDYFIFDGRSLNPGYIISRLCLNYKIPYLATMIATVLLIMTSVLIVSIINHNSRFEWKRDFVPSIIVVTLLWLGLFNSLNEILYWQTGMLYMVELFLITWLYSLILTGNKKTWLIILMSLLAGMSSPNAVIAFLLVLLIEYFHSKKKEELKIYPIAILFLIIGLSLVIFAPGSIARWNIQGGADSKALGNIYELYFRLQQMLSAFIELNTVIVWFMVMGGLMIVIGFSSVNKNKHLIDYLFDFRWMIAALISIGFYFPKMSYYIETSRLNCHFVFFSALFYFNQLSELKINKPEIFDFQERKLKLPVLILGVVFMFTQVLGSKHCLDKLKKREQLFIENQGKDIVLKANDIIGPPRTKFFTDVLEDSTHIFNISIADYYDLKSIRKEKYR